MRRLIIIVIKMRRFIFALTLCLLTASLVTAQQKEAVFTIVGDSIHDFGDIKEANGAVSHVFTIKNTGDAPLVISRATASCGCTQPDYTKDPIAPGKTGEIKVTYDPTGRPAPFNKNVSVFSNGKNGSAILWIKGNVEPKQ